MVVIIDPQNSGIAGNMVAGALIGCGASSKEVKEIMEIGSNDFGGVSVKINNINKNGIHSTFLNVIVENNGVNHSTHNFKDFLGKIDNINSDLFTKSIKECSKRVFNHIATAEAKVHGKTMNNIHFHEVGAADAVADVIGSVFAYYQLGFDKEKVYGLPVAVGGGSITTAHGRLPIPAPATVSILEGIQCFGGPINEELATPTGAALFKEFCNEFTDFIPMIKPRTIAYGAGKKDFSFPNVLRIIQGNSTVESDKIAILETNLDHLTGEELGHLFEVLMNEGALDVSLTPTIMKKNRPGQILKVIAKSNNQEQVLNAIFKETGTLGIRVLPNAHRSILNRKIIKINIDFSEISDNFKESPEEINFKVAMMDNKVISARGEYDDLSKIANSCNVSLKEVNKVAERAINDYLGLN